jgi:hypothetical protein
VKDRFEEAKEWLSTRPEAVEFFCNLFVESGGNPPVGNGRLYCAARLLEMAWEAYPQTRG